MRLVTGSTPPVPNDAVARIRAGDATAFEQVFRACYAPLVAFVYRYTRETATAEDIVQDVFAAVWQQRDRLVVRASLRAYLYAAARNRALNIRKHEAVVEDWERDEASDDVRELHRPPERPDELLDRAQMEALLVAAFESLPERQAQVMRLRWRDELSYAEIAEALGISVKGVEKHLARGIDALRIYMT